MGDGDPRDGRGAEGRLGQWERGVQGVDRVKGLGSSNLEFMWGRRLKSSVHKTGATSRREGLTSRRASLTSRRARELIGQRRDMETNVSTERETINPTL